VKKVFLSYSREDKALVASLKGALTGLDCTVWLDEELSGGQLWWDRILAEIRGCDLFVLGVTEHYVKSTACRRERAYANDVGRPLLPVRLSDVSTNLLPQDLVEIQLVDYRKADTEAALSLARALNRMQAAPALPSPLPSPPPVPTSELERLNGLVQRDSLNYDEQIRLVVDLKASLIGPDPASARSLLEQVRSRRDVFQIVAREVDQALATADGLSEPPKASPPTSDDEPAPGPASPKWPLDRILQTVIGGGIAIAITILALNGILFSPRIDVQATDVDWEPRTPQVGQRVTITGRYTMAYAVRKGLRLSRETVRGQKLNDIFTATWSVDGHESNLEDPLAVTSGDVVEAKFETTFERSGPHEIEFSVRSQKSDAEAGKKKIVRTVYVQ